MRAWGEVYAQWGEKGVEAPPPDLPRKSTPKIPPARGRIRPADPGVLPHSPTGKPEGKAGDTKVFTSLPEGRIGVRLAAREPASHRPVFSFLDPFTIRFVTRDEAEREARRLAAEHPDRETHRWIPREEADGSFVVAKLKMPPGMRVNPLKATVETKPKPPQPDDPRSASVRNVPGAGL